MNSKSLRVGIDAMGGEEGVEVMIPAIIQISAMHPDVQFVVYGNSSKISNELQGRSNVDCIVTENDITDDVKFDTERDLLRGISRGKESSIVQGVKGIKDGELDILVSRGNTGAYIGYSKNTLGNEGSFLALSCWLPRVNVSDIRLVPEDILMMDVGAEVDTTTEKLINNARLGIDYLKKYSGLIIPRFTLLNIGKERYKGDKAYRDAYTEFEKNDLGGKFVGNQESDTLLTDIQHDLIVAGGMVGNTALKGMEGTFKTTSKLIKKEAFGKKYQSTLRC